MKIIYIIIFVFTLGGLNAQNFGTFKQYAEINFDTHPLTDLLGNADLIIQNGATIVYDTDSGSKVTQFSAAQKSNIQFNNSPLNDELTIAFWFKREDADPLSNWRMMFAFFQIRRKTIFKSAWMTQQLKAPYE